MGEYRHAGERLRCRRDHRTATASGDRAAGAVPALVRRRGGLGGAGHASRDRARRRADAGRQAARAAGTSSSASTLPPTRDHGRGDHRRSQRPAAAAPTVPHVLGASRRGAAGAARAAQRSRCSQRTVQQLAQRFGSTSADLRPGPDHRRRRGLERAGDVPGRVDAEARDRRHRARPHRRDAGPGLDARPAPAPDADVLRQRGGERHRDATSAAPPPAARRSSTRLMRSLGLVDTEMYGGYELDALRRAAARPRRRRSRSASTASRAGAAARSTTALRPGEPAARRLARERRPRAAPHRAARASRPPMRATCSTSSPTFATPARSTARSGSCAGVRVLHKAGWINVARHDNGIVLWPGGALVVDGDDLPPGRRRHRRPTCSPGKVAVGGAAAASAAEPRQARRAGHTVGARKRAPTMLAVAPSECATASRCPAPGGDSSG